MPSLRSARAPLILETIRDERSEINSAVRPLFSSCHHVALEAAAAPNSASTPFAASTRLAFELRNFFQRLPIVTLEISEDIDTRERHRLKTNVPKTVLQVKVTQAHLHCGKSMLRGGLWDPRKWPGIRPIPTLFEMIEDQTGIDCEIKDEQKILAQYKKELY